MMLAFLAATVMSTVGTVIEVPDKDTETVRIEALVKLPTLSPIQRSLLDGIAGVFPCDTATFSKGQINDLSGRVGQRLRATAMDDYLRLSYEVLAPDVLTGLSMVASTLREPTLTTSQIDLSLQALRSRRLGYWESALKLNPFLQPKYSERDITNLKTLVFRPENVTVAVVGNFTPGAPTQRWQELEMLWTPGRLPAPERGADPLVKPPQSVESNLSVLEFRAQPILAKDASLPTRLLALVALGNGKGSSLFRIAREKLGWSYRQEAVLSPTESGFLPRLLVVESQDEVSSHDPEALRKALLEDIVAWTDDDRKRAIGMAEASLVRGAGPSSLYFLPSRPVTTGWEDRGFLTAYWRLKTGEAWNPYQLIGKMGFVSLEELKQTALELVTKAQAVVSNSKSG